MESVVVSHREALRLEPLSNLPCRRPPYAPSKGPHQAQAHCHPGKDAPPRYTERSPFPLCPEKDPDWRAPTPFLALLQLPRGSWMPKSLRIRWLPQRQAQGPLSQLQLCPMPQTVLPHPLTAPPAVSRGFSQPDTCELDQTSLSNFPSLASPATQALWRS